MKLLPEEPTQEMWEKAWNSIKVNEELERVRKVLSIHEIRMLMNHFCLAMYATAPEAKDEPVFAKHQPCGCVVCTCDGDRCLGCGAKNCGKHLVGEIPNPIFSRPSPRIAELEREVARLREQLATARRDALEEAAKVCEEDRRIHDWSHCVEAIRALKEKV